MIDKQNISDRFKIIRKELKLNQIEFSKQLDVSHQTISQIENAIIAPSLNIVCNIVSKYRISYNWLLDGEGEMLKGEMPTTTNNSDLVDYLKGEIKELKAENKKLVMEIAKLQAGVK